MYPIYFVYFFFLFLHLSNCNCSASTSFSAHQYYTRELRCIYSSSDLSDMVYIDNFYLNTFLFTQFNSTLGRFVGFSENGMKFAENWNNSTFQQRELVLIYTAGFILKSGTHRTVLEKVSGSKLHGIFIFISVFHLLFLAYTTK